MLRIPGISRLFLPPTAAVADRVAKDADKK